MSFFMITILVFIFILIDNYNNWDDFILEEQKMFPELVAQNNIYYPRLLEVFQDEDPNIIELPNYKKKIIGRKDSFVVEIETTSFSEIS